MSQPNSYLRMVPDRFAAHRSDPAQRIPATRCAAPWTGRLRLSGACSGTNPARTAEPCAAEEHVSAEAACENVHNALPRKRHARGCKYRHRRLAFCLRHDRMFAGPGTEAAICPGASVIGSFDASKDRDHHGLLRRGRQAQTITRPGITTCARIRVRSRSRSAGGTSRSARARPKAPSVPTCDTLAGPDGVQSVDLGIYASWWTNLRTNKSWQMISG
jgi:hypothetical protein